MKKFLLFMIILFVPFIVDAEELKLDFQSSIGGSNGDNIGNVLVTDNDESIVIFSSDSVDGLENKGSSDIYLVKYDQYGNELWKRNWGGSKYEYLASTILTQDDGIIFLPIYVSSTDIEGLEIIDNDGAVVKYDKDGNIQWQRSIHGTDNEILQKVIELSDGSIIVVGRTRSNDIDGLTNNGSFDVIVFKYDKDGNLIWKKSFGGSNWDEITDVKKDSNDNIIISGFTESSTIDELTNHGKYDSFIYKYDKDGNLLWKNIYGGSDYDYVYFLFVTSNNDIILYGTSCSVDISGIENKGDHDAVIVKYSEDGKMLWQKSFGGSAGEYIYGIIEDVNDGIIIHGYYRSSDIDNFELNGISDSFIMKYDKDGNVVKSFTFGGDGGDSVKYLFPYKNKYYIAVGGTSSSKIGEVVNHGNVDILINLYDKDFNIISTQLWGGSENDAFDYFVKINNDNLYIGTEFSSGDIENLVNRNSKDIGLIKYSLTYNIEVLSQENGTSIAKQQGKFGIITPTPDEGYEVDKIIVKNTKDEIIEVTALEDGTYSFPLNDDVTIEVLFKEVLSNPKTGVFDYISFIMIGLLICTIGYVSINYNNQKYEF